MKQKFEVEGMSCQNCVSHVHKAVAALSGVISVEVSLESGSMVVEYDETLVDANAIISAVVEEEYEARVALWQDAR